MMDFGWKKKAERLRMVIIGPRSSPPGAELLVFGWWTWFNQWPLYEVQVNKSKRESEMVRVVPFGSRATDGYEHVDLSVRADEIADDKDKP